MTAENRGSPRLEPVDDDQVGGAVQTLFATIGGCDAEVPLLYRVLASAPELLVAWTDLSRPLRNLDHAPRWLRELVIMRTAQLTGAVYEWAHHWKFAIKAGVTRHQLEALERWHDSAAFDEPTRHVLAYTDELVTGGEVTDEIFSRLAARFDEPAVIQLTMTAAFYVCVARVASALRVPLEARYEDVPPLRRPTDDSTSLDHSQG